MIELNILKNEESNHLIRGRVGDIPKKPLVFKIFDDITPLDLTGAIVKFYARTSSGAVLIDVIVKITDPKNGIVEFSLPKNIFSSKGNFLSAYFGISKGAFFDTTNDMNITVLPNVDVSETHAKEVISNIEKLVEEAVEIINKGLSATKVDLDKTKTKLEGIKKQVDTLLAEIKAQTDKQLVAIKDSLKSLEVKVVELNKLLEEGGFATKKEAQLIKITEDDGSCITLSGYDLLNTTDSKNFDGYVTSATNTPTNSNAGYVKRKYRSGYIEIIYAPHSQKDVYRNAYNASAEKWIGWTKTITAADNYQIPAITENTGKAKIYLTGNTVDVYKELLLLETGFYTIYISANTINAAPTTVRGTVFVEYKGKWLSVLGVGSNNKIYSLHYTSVAWTGWGEVETAVKDTGWMTLKTTADFTAYGSEELVYRTVGNQTYVSGVVTPTKDLEQGTTERLIATLPVGSRPSKTINLICQGTSINKWLLLIKTDGKISASRYGTTKYENMTKGTWLPLAPVVFLND